MLRHAWLPRVREERQQGSPRGTKLRSHKSAHIRSVEGNGGASVIDNDQVPVLLAIWGKYTGVHGLVIESGKRVRCRPAGSSTDVCYRGTPPQCPRRSNASHRVCSYSKGVWYVPGLVCQNYSFHYPVGKPFFGDSLSILLSSKADEELVWGPETLRAVHVNSNGWVCLLPGQCLQDHHLIPKGRGGNFGHISRPGLRTTWELPNRHTNHRPKMPACPLPSWRRPMQWGALSLTTET